MSEVIMFWTILAIANAVVLLAMIKISSGDVASPIEHCIDREPQWVVKWSPSSRDHKDDEVKP